MSMNEMGIFLRSKSDEERFELSKEYKEQLKLNMK